MRSQRPKVLFEICGRSILAHSIEAVRGVRARRTVVVVGYGREEVVAQFQGQPDLVFATQDPPRGTGDAVRVGMTAVPESAETVLVTYGDMPCLTTETIQRLLDARPKGGVALLTVTREEAHGFGRILRDPDGGFLGIREEKDCSPAERAIREVNVGVYAFDREALARALPRLRADNQQGEYYLTDAVLEIARLAGLVREVRVDDESETMGVNSLTELALARDIWQERILDRHLTNGVLVVDPASTYIEVDVSIGAGSTIHPFTVLRRGVRVGADCEVGPFAHLRPGARLADGVRVGNFVEVKNSKLARGVKAMHLSYLGDTTVGAESNIGAGTITANYDGHDKWPTVIGSKVFVGSGTVLVAPTTVGSGALLGAGAIVVKKRVPAGATWVGVPAKPLRSGASAEASSNGIAGSAAAKERAASARRSKSGGSVSAHRASVHRTSARRGSEKTAKVAKTAKVRPKGAAAKKKGARSSHRDARR